MRKLAFFLIVFLLSFIGCDKGCTDSTACNYGVETEECKYATHEESLLKGTWNLVYIYEPDGTCVFSFSSDCNSEEDDLFESINFIFNDDQTCEVLTTPSSFSDPIPTADWSINICENKLVFINATSGYENYIYQNFSPFGSQKIIQLSWDIFVSEDLAGNFLHWEKM